MRVEERFSRAAATVAKQCYKPNNIQERLSSCDNFKASLFFGERKSE